MILFALGTRPEVIKLAPLIREAARRQLSFRILFTGQHRELFQDVSDLIPPPDADLDVMTGNHTLNEVLSSIIARSERILKEISPSLVIVQGDTTTVLGVSLAAFNLRIPIGHVEAGLRTHDLSSPFPEEGNRQMVSRIAAYNWAPTPRAARQLLAEGITNVHMTGNTVIDACLSFPFEPRYGDNVLITLHRRENAGERMQAMAAQLERLAKANPDLNFIFPMHPNPQVQALRTRFEAVKVIDPLPYREMIAMLAEMRCAITDSGGIQEECAAFRKKVIVCRDTTERPESVEVGLARLADTDIEAHFEWAAREPEWNGENPYGDGKASQRILDILQSSQIEPT
jgi:UDP-N-acetylglucosamine 2-epimerase (non-hydrolysing)